MYGKGSLMSPFAFFSSVSRKPLLRWLLIALLLAGLLMITSRAWSAPVASKAAKTDAPKVADVAPKVTTRPTAKDAAIASKAPITHRAKAAVTAAKATVPHTAKDAAIASKAPAAHPAKTVEKSIVIVVSEEQIVKAEAPKAQPSESGLTAVPDSFTIKQGAGGSSSISINAGPSTSPVKFTESGLPAGVYAFFTPVDAAGRSTVIVTASKTAPTGPVKMSISAGSGASTTVTVNVIHDSDPDFQPTVLPGRISVSQGSDSSCEVSLSPSNGFTAPVSLTLRGVPEGVTATFEPQSTSTKSKLHITATKEAAAAGTPITILATSGGITHTARVLLSVEARADFGLSAWTNRVSMAPGAMGADTVNIDSMNGFTAPVSLEVSGLPAGVTGHFSPAIAKTGTSTLLLTSDGTVSTGSTMIKVTAKSGGIVHESTINLDIVGETSPSFAVTTWPADLTVFSGGRAANTVRIVRSHGFDGEVNLTISGLPDGITADFAPSSTRGSSTLTVSARPGVSIDAPISAMITGVSGGVSHTANISLHVGSRQASATSANHAF